MTNRENYMPVSSRVLVGKSVSAIDLSVMIKDLECLFTDVNSLRMKLYIATATGDIAAASDAEKVALNLNLPHGFDRLQELTNTIHRIQEYGDSLRMEIACLGVDAQEASLGTCTDEDDATIQMIRRGRASDNK